MDQVKHQAAGLEFAGRIGNVSKAARALDGRSKSPFVYKLERVGLLGITVYKNAGDAQFELVASLYALGLRISRASDGYACSLNRPMAWIPSLSIRAGLAKINGPSAGH